MANNDYRKVVAGFRALETENTNLKRQKLLQDRAITELKELNALLKEDRDAHKQLLIDTLSGMKEVALAGDAAWKGARYLYERVLHRLAPEEREEAQRILAPMVEYAQKVTDELSPPAT